MVNEHLDVKARTVSSLLLVLQDAINYGAHSFTEFEYALAHITNLASELVKDIQNL